MGMGSWPGSRVETGEAGRARADRWFGDIYTPMLFLMIKVAVAFSHEMIIHKFDKIVLNLHVTET